MTLWALILGLLLGVFVVAEFAVWAGFRINLSASMPKGLYRLADCTESAQTRARVGDLVAIDPYLASDNPELSLFRQRGWLQITGRADDLLMKRIVAEGGDEVTEQDGQLFVNDVALGRDASKRERSADGLRLPKPLVPHSIEPGYVWLSSDHPRGIDSRYFGAVARAAIACTVEATWTW